MSGTAVVLTISARDRNTELLIEFLEAEGYGVTTVQDLPELDAIIESNLDQTRLAILDVQGYSRAVWDRCERLSGAEVPVLVLKPVATDEMRTAAHRHGARAVLSKPVSKRDLGETIKVLLSE